MEKERCDYLIVGAGFSGAVLAQKLAEEKNRKVIVIDKRQHIGGNSYDYYNEHGVLVHKYGPHYFRTDDSEVWEFLSKFTEWRHYQYVIKVYTDAQLFDFPINLNTINQFYGKSFDSKEAREFMETVREKIDNPANAEEQVLSQVGRDLYDKFFKNYTIKQWGLDPKELDASVTARIPIRFNRDPRYFDSYYQVMPRYGYHKLFENMFDHPNIVVKLGVDFFEHKEAFEYETLIYTGCIDEFFEYKYGKLSYRSLRFEFETLEQEYYQQYPQINYPNEYNFTRIVEIKHATGQRIGRTTIVREYSQDCGEPFYPIPKKDNLVLYEKYKEETKKYESIIFIGRLAQYRYLNMDQIVKNALRLFQGLISPRQPAKTRTVE